jgi:porphobilinogen synthase
MKHPLTRPRRLRQNHTIREMVRETTVGVENLIQPLFITEKASPRTPINSMPGIFRFSSKSVLKEVEELLKVGISTIALFPDTPIEKRTEDGREAHSPNGLTQQTIKRIKDAFPEICIMADVALDPFTTHGHDGLLGKNQEVLNDQTLEVLSMQASSLAQAGADIVAPSDMMDGRIGVIRNALEQGGFKNTIILSYCIKFASSLYAPFREGVGSGSTLKKKDKKGYQINPHNINEIFIEADLDINEGADILMVKPGLPYLDILSKLREHTNLPLAAYHTSGEYSMQKTAINNGFIPEDTIYEILLSFRRAGANIVVSYFSKEFAKNHRFI